MMLMIYQIYIYMILLSFLFNQSHPKQGSNATCTLWFTVGRVSRDRSIREREEERLGRKQVAIEMMLMIYQIYIYMILLSFLFNQSHPKQGSNATCTLGVYSR